MKSDAKITCDKCGYSELIPDAITIINTPEWSGGYTWDERINKIVEIHNEEKHKKDYSEFNVSIISK